MIDFCEIFHPGEWFCFLFVNCKLTVSSLLPPLTKTDVSDTNQESTTIIKELKLIVAKLQGEIVDVVDKMENLAAGSTSRKSNPASPPPKPLFRNPRDIPAFDAIDELDDEESPEATPVDDSVVSIDEFVPDITVHVPHIQEEHSSLNCNNLTIQPC